MTETEKKKSYAGMYHGMINLYDVNSLSGYVEYSFIKIAAEYGLRVEGIEDDANEWGDFFHTVAKDILERIP